MPTIVLLKRFRSTQKLAFFYEGAFHKNSPSVACGTFNKLEIKNLTPNRFKINLVTY